MTLDQLAERRNAITQRLREIGPVPYGQRGRVIAKVAREFGVSCNTVWQNVPLFWRTPDRWARRKGRAGPDGLTRVVREARELLRKIRAAGRPSVQGAGGKTKDRH